MLYTFAASHGFGVEHIGIFAESLGRKVIGLRRCSAIKDNRILGSRSIDGFYLARTEEEGVACLVKARHNIILRFNSSCIVEAAAAFAIDIIHPNRIVVARRNGDCVVHIKLARLVLHQQAVARLARNCYRIIHIQLARVRI